MFTINRYWQYSLCLNVHTTACLSFFWHTQDFKNKVNQFSIGLYSDYNENGYQVTVGHEVSTPQEGVAIKRIPAGKYAKFFITGNMQKAVADAWGEIWGMELDRSYAADFEEYLNADCENAEINIYIALN